MKRKQFNSRIPQSHIDRLNAMRDDLTQSEFLMRLIDEEWTRRNTMPTPTNLNGKSDFTVSQDGDRIVVSGYGKSYSVAGNTPATNQFGNETGYTVAEEFDNGTLDVHDFEVSGVAPMMHGSLVGSM